MSATKRHEIEALIDADPAADEPYLVLADLLTEAGDPRGELILLQHRHHFDARHDVLLRTLQPPIPAPGGIEWHCGFVSAAQGYLLATEAESLAVLLAHPSTRFVHSLDVRVDGGEDDATSWLLPAIVGAPCRAALRALALGLERTDAITVPRGALDLTALATATPGLRRLDATAQRLELRAAGPHLTHVMLDGEIRGGDLASLLAAAPALVRLEVRDLVDGRPFWEALAGDHVLEELLVTGESLHDGLLPLLEAARLYRPTLLTLPDAPASVREALQRRDVHASHAARRDLRRYDASAG